MSTPEESHDSIWGNFLVSRVAGLHSVLTGESTGCGRNLAGICQPQLDSGVQGSGLDFLFICKCRWEHPPESVVWERRHPQWASARVLFGKNIEQDNNTTVNRVNVASPPQTQVGPCKTNDRKNLKNYSVNQIRQSNLSSNLLIGHLSGVMDCVLSFLPRNSFLITHCNYLRMQKTCIRCVLASPQDFCLGFFSVFLQYLINNPNSELIPVWRPHNGVLSFLVYWRDSLPWFVLHYG